MRFVLTGTLVLTASGAAVAFIPTGTRSTADVSASRRNAGRAADPVALPRTNAVRLARGLPLLPPRRRSDLHPARSQTSAVPPTTVTCNILVTRDDNALGYVSTATTSGAYGTVQEGTDGALEVSFSFSLDSPSQLSLTVNNGPYYLDYPFFGGIIGSMSNSNNLEDDNASYAVIGGTVATDPGSRPVSGANSVGLRAFETAIWRYDTTTKVLSPYWTDEDGPRSSHAVDVSSNGNTLILSDTDLSNFDLLGTVQPVTLTCTPRGSGARGRGGRRRTLGRTQRSI
ncbi:hypothetical protein FB451DRAFT_1558008 [Mycena latifolia]|nr:hypothetical protein FB451DRAFT_1558008 [Mycena latifolia]